jgi:hypothetical protein
MPCIIVVEGGDFKWDTTKPKSVAKIIVVKKNVTCDRYINTTRTENEEPIDIEKHFSDINMSSDPCQETRPGRPSDPRPDPHFPVRRLRCRKHDRVDRREKEGPD